MVRKFRPATRTIGKYAPRTQVADFILAVLMDVDKIMSASVLALSLIHI